MYCRHTNWYSTIFHTRSEVKFQLNSERIRIGAFNWYLLWPIRWHVYHQNCILHACFRIYIYVWKHDTLWHIASHHQTIRGILLLEMCIAHPYNHGGNSSSKHFVQCVYGVNEIVKSNICNLLKTQVKFVTPSPASNEPKRRFDIASGD